MAKQRKGRSASVNMTYNRPSKGMQTNYARADFKEVGLDALKKKNNAKILKGMKITLIAWVSLTVLLTVLYKIPGLLDSLFFGIIVASGWLIYINKLDRDIIRAYQKLNIPKDKYLDELIKRKVNKKRLRKISKMWDKVEKKTSKKVQPKKLKPKIANDNDNSN